jgi:uroporphyrinogen decarboxylase
MKVILIRWRLVRHIDIDPYPRKKEECKMAMSHIERAMASITNQPVDRLSVYPIACGVNRKLLSTPTTYSEWASDPRKFAEAAIAGYKYFDWDWYFGLMDLSVMAADVGAGVRFDEQNTPFVTDPLVKNPEDYEKIKVPDVKKGRCGVIIEGTKIFAERLGKDIITSGFIEGPLLALTQPARRRSSWTCTTTAPRCTRP